MRSKNALKNIIFSLLQNIILIIFGFIVPKAIITKFGSNVNGLINSITQFLAYITLLEAGIGPVIKSKLYKPLANNDKQEIEDILCETEKFFRTIAKIFICYILILCIIYPIIVRKEFTTGFTITLLIIISFSTLAEYYFGLTYSLYLQAKQQTYITSIFQIIATVLNTIGIIILIKLNANIFLIKLLSSLMLIIRPLLLSYYVKKKYKINFKKSNNKYILENKWDGLAQHIAAVIHNNTDIAILTIFSNIAEVSVYSVYILVIKGTRNIVSALTGGIDVAFGDMIAKKEDETLNRSFNTYEMIYYTLITIIYSCTLILIIPFIVVYTKGIKDVNYIREEFAFLIVFAEYIYSMRIPYSSVTLAAGHFKETMKGAWIESFTNIFISIILVFKFGIIGVAIGTLIAMIIRTIEFNYHTSKYILRRNTINGFAKSLLAIFETVIIYFILKLLKMFEIKTYLSWMLYAIIVFSITSIIVIFFNIIFYRKELSNIKNLLKKILNKKTKN